MMMTTVYSSLSQIKFQATLGCYAEILGNTHIVCLTKTNAVADARSVCGNLLYSVTVTYNVTDHYH